MAGLLGKDQIKICFFEIELTHKQMLAEKRLEMRTPRILADKKTTKVLPPYRAESYYGRKTKCK